MSRGFERGRRDAGRLALATAISLGSDAVSEIRHAAAEVEMGHPVACARSAGLRYVSDVMPGIRRRCAGEIFTYTAPLGGPLRDGPALERIRALAVPPAWTDVWICPSPQGHLQATGRDAKGRKQYRYHERWRAVRDETKYGKLHSFGEVLPRIREKVERDLARHGLPRDKVLATVVRLLDLSFIRIGNPEYARANESFGLTTMRDEHVEIRGERVRFKFRGKSGKEHDIDVWDRQLARVMRRCQELDGQELFQYLDEDGQPRTIESADVNGYLRAAAGEGFTAKDFRTWAGTVLAARELARVGPFESETEARRNVASAVREVARQLGNTEAVCRKCYVHPVVIDGYLDGSLLSDWRDGDDRGEETVLSLLGRRLAA